MRRALALAAITAALIIHPVPADAATRAEIVQMIRARFGPHADHAVAVARCESTLIPSAVHRNRNGTRDWGLFQLNDGGTLQSLGITPAQALDPATNIDAAARLHRRRGWQPWVCSRHHRKGP